jgi:hypothetical protein
MRRERESSMAREEFRNLFGLEEEGNGRVQRRSLQVEMSLEKLRTTSSLAAQPRAVVSSSVMKGPSRSWERASSESQDETTGRSLDRHGLVHGKIFHFRHVGHERGLQYEASNCQDRVPGTSVSYLTMRTVAGSQDMISH